MKYQGILFPVLVFDKAWRNRCAIAPWPFLSHRFIKTCGLLHQTPLTNPVRAPISQRPPHTRKPTRLAQAQAPTRPPAVLRYWLELCHGAFPEPHYFPISFYGVLVPLWLSLGGLEDSALAWTATDTNVCPRMSVAMYRYPG